MTQIVMPWLPASAINIKQTDNVACGLLNVGNSCYLNCVLQILIRVQSLDQFFGEFWPVLDSDAFTLSSLSMSEKEETLNILTALRESHAAMQKCNRNIIKSGNGDTTISSPTAPIDGRDDIYSPMSLLNIIQRSNPLFTSGGQQDAHELLCYVLDKWCLPLHVVCGRNKALLKQFFGWEGVLRTVITCCECGQSSSRNETFRELSLRVVSGHSLSWALREYCAGERLRDGNKYFCENCLHSMEAVRKVSIIQFPRYLCIHFQRNDSVTSSSKKQSVIPSPMTLRLDMCASTDDSIRQETSPTYELFAIVIHAGGSGFAGHYYTYVQTSKEKEKEKEKDGNSHWLRCDDTSVKNVSTAEILSLFTPCAASVHTPYMLFYRQIS